MRVPYLVYELTSKTPQQKFFLTFSLSTAYLTLDDNCVKVDYLQNTYALPLFENALTPENNNKMLMISLSQRPSKSVDLFWGKARKSAKREEGPPDHRLLCYVRIDIGAFLILEIIIIGGDKRSPQS